MPVFFTITVSLECRLHVYSLYLKGGVPRRGEQCLVENASYKGYSPSKCTCNAFYTFTIHIPTRTCQFYMESYMPCHEWDATHHVPYARALTDSLTQCLSPCLNNYHFSNDIKLSFSFNSYSFYLQSRALLWVVEFWCRTVGSTNPDTFTIFHRWGLCLTIIDGSFTLGGIYPNLLIPSAYYPLPFL